MLTQSIPLVIPPAPKVHAKDLPVWRHLLLAQRNSIGIFPDYAFDVPFARRTLLGVHAVLINDPEGIRHVMATNAYNYVRPKPKRTSLWPPYYADTESFALTRARCFPSHALPSSRASGRCSGWSGSNREFPLLRAAPIAMRSHADIRSERTKSAQGRANRDSSGCLSREWGSRL